MIFITRNIFIKVDNNFNEVSITINKPEFLEDGFYHLSVEFSNIKKYNANIKGIDDFNALECALDYVNTICKNSTDPEFFFTESESMFQNNFEQ